MTPQIPTPVTKTVIDHVEMMVRQDSASSLRLFFKKADGVHEIEFPKESLAHLLAGLLGMPAPTSGNPIEMPSIVTLGFQAFQESDGDVGLAFSLPGGWLLPFSFPISSIPALKEKVRDLEALAKPGKPH